MRLLLIAAALLTHLPRAAVAQSAVSPPTESALAGEVRRLITARIASALAGDSTALHRLLAPGYVHVNENGNRQTAEPLLRYVGGNRPPPGTTPPAWQVTVTRAEARRVGAVLLADAHVTIETRVGAGVVSMRSRDMNVLVRHGGQWRFAQHSETPVEALGDYPVVAAPDSAELGAFVGDYESWPGLVDRITQRGAGLYVQDPDHPEWGAGRLVPAGAEAFYPEDDSAALMMFARDATGRVTHFISRFAGGPLIIARKVR
jgi:hypothetical protein